MPELKVFYTNISRMSAWAICDGVKDVPFTLSRSNEDDSTGGLLICSFINGYVIPRKCTKWCDTCSVDGQKCPLLDEATIPLVRLD